MAKKKPSKKVLKFKKEMVKAKSPTPATLPLKGFVPVKDKEATLPPRELLQAPRGMRDILPLEEPFWNRVKDQAREISYAFGYSYIETPLLEHKALFVRSIGSGTDVVQKEMYAFKDQGGDELCLRPEGTAAVARAYINHGMLNLPQPVKFWYLGQFFRRERPQSGRYRQFHQWGLEVLGDAHPILDAEIISLAYMWFKELGLGVRVEMNSIGCQTCREAYKEELLKFYTPKQELLCENCKVRLQTNRLRLLDCKEAQCELLKEGAPQITDFICEPCREHFMRVLEYLDELGIAYTLNPHIVRGLDYYNRTVFEFFYVPEQTEVKKVKTASEAAAEVKEEEPAGKSNSAAPEAVTNDAETESIPGALNALGGGGRYDGLVEQLGGRPTPAVGCSIGLERVITALRNAEITPTRTIAPRVFIAQLGDGARRKAFTLWHTLRKEVPAAAALSKDGLKAQLEIANRLGVRYTIIIGQKEILDQTAIIRDMEAGIQEVVDYNKVVSDIKKKLEEPH